MQNFNKPRNETVDLYIRDSSLDNRIKDRDSFLMTLYQIEKSGWCVDVSGHL